MKAIDVDCSKLSLMIDEKIHDARNREILKRRLLDNQAHCQIAFEFGLSDRQIKNIVKKGKSLLGLE